MTKFSEHQVVSSCDEHIIAVDKNFIIQYINYTTNDKTVEQVVGKPIGDLLPPESSQLALDNIRKSVEDGMPSEYKTNYFLPNGDELIFKANVKPLLKDGQIYGAVIVAKDVTSTDRALKEAELKVKGQARLASIGMLAAGVGHEINNPLAIAKGFLRHNLSEISSLINKDQAKRFDQIQSAIVRIENIVKGLRNFSRSDKVTFEKINVEELILDSINFVQDIYSKDKVVIEVLNHGDISIFGDPGKIQQVILNLLSNAKDAMSACDKKIIQVSFTKHLDEVKILIKDSGVGMSEELLTKVFEPFFTTKKINEGTGIGLSLVKTIVEEHNGKIKVRSVPNKGSEFIITLPEFKDSSNQKIKVEPKDRKEIGKIDLKGKRVLLVDDEDGIREVLCDIMGDFGLNIIDFKMAQDALIFLQTNEVDFIISDVKMPGIDGLEFFYKVKEEKLSPKSKFFFITGGIDVDFNNLESNYYPSGVIYKPFDELKIRKLLEESAE